MLEFRPNGFRIVQELMEIFRVFYDISLILLFMRISTGQRFRKEQSVKDTNIMFPALYPLKPG